MAQMFTDINQLDPNVKSYINDYNIVDSSHSTVASILNVNLLLIIIFHLYCFVSFLKILSQGKLNFTG